MVELKKQRGSCPTFSKVSALVYLPYKTTIEHTFENEAAWLMSHMLKSVLHGGFKK
jgi:hypothetical protein